MQDRRQQSLQWLCVSQRARRASSFSGQEAGSCRTRRISDTHESKIQCLEAPSRVSSGILHGRTEEATELCPEAMAAQDGPAKTDQGSPKNTHTVCFFPLFLFHPEYRSTTGRCHSESSLPLSVGLRADHPWKCPTDTPRAVLCCPAGHSQSSWHVMIYHDSWSCVPSGTQKYFSISLF